MKMLQQQYHTLCLLSSPYFPQIRPLANHPTFLNKKKVTSQFKFKAISICLYLWTNLGISVNKSTASCPSIEPAVSWSSVVGGFVGVCVCVGEGLIVINLWKHHTHIPISLPQPKRHARRTTPSAEQRHGET